ncbi:MAG: LysR family transcriptional regulator [Candidatus Thiodiazotropha sp. (ex Lucina pensylvanica)]|nr:LysR family transcriptional regulator [Candidatus Thiodiazotropha sp. (ex Lucina pensylvanica)]MBT3049565.1 LysR family transcriptional regulator [Candidatus Thiodiazotropha sp. (ex Codakia orbicularis)]
MDRLECLESFVAVVESGQFSAAAERLGLGKSVISRRVSELEEYLGALLIQRTTRRLSLTEAGRTFYPRAIQLLEDLADAEQSVSSAQHALSGRIRLAAPLSFGLMHLAPALNSFMSKHPGVILDMDFNDSQVDLIQEGVDLALRIGQLEDSTMVALPLAPIRTILCASPGYLTRYGTPETPEALTGHQCLCYSNLPEPQKWRFVDRKGVAHSVRVENRMLANNGQIILEAAASGHGICISPTFIAYRTILEGRLVPILADYELPTATAYAIYPNRRFIPQRVRILAEYFRELFGERPYWDEGLV